LYNDKISDTYRVHCNHDKRYGDDDGIKNGGQETTAAILVDVGWVWSVSIFSVVGPCLFICTIKLLTMNLKDTRA
jgi:hypothetical protein